MKNSTQLKYQGFIGLIIGAKETFFPTIRTGPDRDIMNFFIGSPPILLIISIFILILVFWPGNDTKIDK